MPFEQLVSLGLLALFGSVPPAALIGWLVARRRGFETGAGVALEIFGAAGLGAALAVAVFIAVSPAAVAALDDPRQPYAMVGVFGAFGGFGVLGGGVLLAGAARRRREQLGPVPAAAPVGAERARWGRSFTIAGNLAIVGCALASGLLDLDAVRATTLMFGGVVAGCACFLVAFACHGRLTLELALTLLLIGGGFALALASLRYLG